MHCLVYNRASVDWARVDHQEAELGAKIGMEIRRASSYAFRHHLHHAQTSTSSCVLNNDRRPPPPKTCLTTPTTTMTTTPLPPRTSSMPSTPSGPVPERVLSPTRTPNNNAAADARRAARREQLRDFYGLKRDGASSPGPGSAPATPGGGSTGNGNGNSARRKQRRGGDALDLTSPNFSPSEYYEDLIAKATLAELMGSTSVLAADVGRLHSSRHTLVYNHHHQLFSAGDTIAQLNTRTPQLLSIVTSLQERFSDISQLADSVALTEKAPLGDGERARAAAAQGLERVRLMVLAGDGPDAVKAAWERTEAEVKGYGDVEGLDGILAEGREVVAVAAAK